MPNRDVHPAIDPDSWDTGDSEVMVADGAEVRVAVRNGQLEIRDGVRGNIRVRTLPRVPRQTTRLFILARHGYVTLEALRWMNGANVRVTHVADEVTMTGGAAEGDPRMIHAQARKPVKVARYLIAMKVAEQAETLRMVAGPNRAAERLESITAGVRAPGPVSVDGLRALEGQAGAVYWQSWRGMVRVPWAPDDLVRVPAHWRSYPGRPNMLTDWDTNRYATDPVNAMLNYIYKVLESETLHACRAFGLHPDIGLIHAEGTDRHAFVLDLMEPVRPFCDRIVLRFLNPYGPDGRMTYFDRRWIHEGRNGVVELDPPLTHRIAGSAADIGSVVFEYAKEIRESLSHE